MALFTVAGFSPLDNVKVNSTLHDPKHPLPSLLVYLHSMESFIYQQLQRSTVQNDAALIDGLGPYAWAFQRIV